MKLIDLYVHEVGRHLPEKMRPDLEKEIRSVIEDTLEDESRARGQTADETLVVEVLQRLGPPEKMAAAYLPPRYLIGPQLFPYFVNTLRVILPLLTLLAAVSIGFSLGDTARSAAGLASALFRAWLNLLGTLFTAFSITVVIYAALQWVSPNFASKEKDWDPRQLKAEPDPERAKLGETLANVVFNVFALVLLNVYPEWIGISLQTGGQWTHISMLTPAFALYLPWISLMCVLEAGRNAWLAAQGRWTRPLRWFTVGVNLANIGLAAALLVGPAIIALAPDALSHAGVTIPAEAAQRLAEGLTQGLRLVWGLIVALKLFEVGEHLYRLLSSRLLPQPV